MKLYGMEKLSLVDYDGKVAATVFTGACNFKCGFCHNGPLVTGLSTLEPLDEERVLSYLKERKNILEGVCVSGGEPTLNRDLPAFAEKIKNLGLDVKLDTNGSNPDMIRTLHENGLVDYFAMDIKNSPESYPEIIGIDGYDISAVKKSVEYFLSGSADYEFRTTLIKEYHKEDNVRRIGEWIKGAKKYALQKFRESETCISAGLNGIDLDTAKRFAEILKRNFVPDTLLRGYD